MKHRTWRSDWTSTSTGLFQGSPLSPVLFNIHTLPLARLNNPHCKLRTFADDILVNCRGKSAQDMIDLISSTSRNIGAYCECSGMHCNGEKAESMLCTWNNRLQPSSFPPTRYDGKEIRIQTHFVTLASSLTDSSTSLSMSTLSSNVVSRQPISWRFQLVGRLRRGTLWVVQEPRPLCCRLRFAYDQHQPEPHGQSETIAKRVSRHHYWMPEVNSSPCPPIFGWSPLHRYTTETCTS